NLRFSSSLQTHSADSFPFFPFVAAERHALRTTPCAAEVVVRDRYLSGDTVVLGDVLRAVDLGVAQQAGAFLVGQLAPHLAGDAGDERPGRDVGVLEHDGSPGHEGPGTDARAVEDDGAHSDERAVADGAAVDDGVVPHRHVLADHDGRAAVDVHRHVVLQVAA